MSFYKSGLGHIRGKMTMNPDDKKVAVNHGMG
jgi:hypothetical protein